ncbi:MAG: DUF2628 domain-containing protein [Rhizobacter sp.]
MTEPAAENIGDFVPVATCATPTEAHLLKETLVAAGLSAEVADANFVQANPWMSNAVGGVRVLVPASLVSEAKATVDAFHAGAFQLDANHGVAADASPEAPVAEAPGLRTFLLYHHPTRKPAVLAVKQGFSWAAFIIGPVWFILNGMWLTALLSLSFTWGAPWIIRLLGGSANSGGGVVQLLAVAAFVAVWIFTAKVANFLFGEELKRKGYVAGDIVRARTAGEAISAR